MSLFLNLAIIDLKSYLRNSYAIFFTFLFPVLLLILLMLAFGGEKGAYVTKVNVLGNSPSAVKYHQDLTKILGHEKSVGYVINAFEGKPLAEAVLDDAAINVLIPDDKTKKLQIDIGENVSINSNDRFYGILLVNAMGNIAYEKWNQILDITVKSKSKMMDNFKYGQYLIPGLVGMILISTSLFGFCTYLVEQRSKGAFKAYHLFPIAKWKFIAAFATTRFIILVFFSIVFLVVADKAYGQNAAFDLALLAKITLLIALGALAFLSIGLLISARIMALGVVTAVTNLLFFPATFASDLYIPQGGFPQIVKSLANIFPLGPFAESLRDITYKGASLGDISYTIWLLVIWTIVCFIASTLLFKWHNR